MSTTRPTGNNKRVEIIEEEDEDEERTRNEIDSGVGSSNRRMPQLIYR